MLAALWRFEVLRYAAWRCAMCTVVFAVLCYPVLCVLCTFAGGAQRAGLVAHGRSGTTVISHQAYSYGRP
jgi:hypothetical protein